ncbi:hypothetical protein ABT336_11745 [Micromonospora sp. NPDC000207]|uniref:hypothetical protein n=1 Tax=Micromonospora sp. NPDC000207 TaxID=3154246 RepID=UPI003329C9E4
MDDYVASLDPFAGEQSEMMLGVSGESVNQPQDDRAAYIAALDALPEGQLPRQGETVEAPGFSDPVPLDDSLGLGHPGQFSEPDPDDSTRVKPPARKRTRRPHAVYAAALNALPEGKLPKKGQTVKVPGHDVPVPIGEFVNTLRGRGIMGAKVGQVLVDALRRHDQVLEPHPDDSTRVKLPSTGKVTRWPRSVYAAALNACPAGQLPKFRQSVKVSGHDVPVPIGNFLNTLRNKGIVGANVDQVLVDALRRHGQRLESYPGKAGKVRLVRDVDGAATHVVAAMAGPGSQGQVGFAGREASGSQSKPARVLAVGQVTGGPGR